MLRTPTHNSLEAINASLDQIQSEANSMICTLNVRILKAEEDLTVYRNK